jgi:hypothetical protein
MVNLVRNVMRFCREHYVITCEFPLRNSAHVKDPQSCVSRELIAFQLNSLVHPFYTITAIIKFTSLLKRRILNQVHQYESIEFSTIWNLGFSDHSRSDHQGGTIIMYSIELKFFAD